MDAHLSGGGKKKALPAAAVDVAKYPSQLRLSTTWSPPFQYAFRYDQQLLEICLDIANEFDGVSETFFKNVCDCG